MTRLKILTLINKSENIKKLYYKASKPMLDIIVGNELVMQKKLILVYKCHKMIVHY